MCVWAIVKSARTHRDSCALGLRAGYCDIRVRAMVNAVRTVIVTAEGIACVRATAMSAYVLPYTFSTRPLRVNYCGPSGQLKHDVYDYCGI